MQDDPKDQPNENNSDEIEEILENEDLDESLEEGDWDEFDEELEDNFDEINDDDVLQPSANKTFLQKYFLFVVVGIIVIFGGLLFIGLSGGNTPPTENITPPETAENNAPPMPTPLNTQVEAESPDNTDTLTPLPDETNLANASLDEFDFSAIEEMADDEPLVEEDNLFDIEKNLETSINTDNNIKKLETAPKTIEKIPSPKKDMTAQEIIQKMPASADNQSNISKTPAKVTIDSEIYGQIETLESRFSATNTKIDQLLDSIEILKNQVQDLTQQQKDMNVRVSKISKEAAKNNATSGPRTKATQSSSKPQRQKSAPKPKKERVWILRAAGPGKAVVGETGSSDFKTVQVGDILEGIGEIRSIGFKDGQWVVQGTKGSIHQ